MAIVNPLYDPNRESAFDCYHDRESAVNRDSDFATDRDRPVALPPHVLVIVLCQDGKNRPFRMVRFDISNHR